MPNYVEFEKKVREALTKRAYNRVNSPERKKEALRQVNETVAPEAPPAMRTEPDQSSQAYGTAHNSQARSSDYHDHINREPAYGTNNDDAEYHDEHGEQRIARKFADYDDTEYYTSEFMPYAGMRRPADYGEGGEAGGE